MLLVDDGQLFTFGCNQYGQLGIGTKEETRRVCKVDSLTNVKRVTCGDTFTVAITHGQYQCRQWTCVTSKDRCSLAHLDDLDHCQNLCFVLENQVYTWGNKSRGRLGNGDRDAIYPNKIAIKTERTALVSASASNGGCLIGFHIDIAKP